MERGPNPEAERRQRAAEIINKNKENTHLRGLGAEVATDEDLTKVLEVSELFHDLANLFDKENLVDIPTDALSAMIEKMKPLAVPANKANDTPIIPWLNNVMGSAMMNIGFLLSGEATEEDFSDIKEEIINQAKQFVV